MKKLMFATALVASAAAFAAPINATSFEGYTADTAVISNGGGDVGEQGAGDNYFCYEGDQDGSMVKAYDVGDNLTAPVARPLYFASASPNANYLELSTEGGTLWRSIDPIRSYTVDNTTTYSNGAPVAVAATGTYLDTLVQFTPTEDGGAPELGEKDKLAIWLNVDSNQQTNLMVKANLYDMGEAPSATPTTFTLAAAEGTKTIVAGEWYRLTIKAIPNVTLTDDNGVIPAFEIYVDGVQMRATTAQFTTAMVETFASMDALSEYMTAAIAANKIFPSLAEMGNQGDTPTLEGVGFKGSGAIDDLVWTTEDPFQGGAGGDDYKVEIGGNDVVITPTAADLAAIAAAAQAAGQTIDVNDKAAVNELLATVIPGTDGIQAWEAAFLGVEPSTNGLEQVAIKSISFDEDGKVVVEMADAIELKTGRGVTINLILKGSDDLTTWTTLQTATDTTEFTAITPAANETKKFYKVVVEFAATPAQN